jgi:hypothetical protein
LYTAHHQLIDRMQSIATLCSQTLAKKSMSHYRAPKSVDSLIEHSSRTHLKVLGLRRITATPK